MIDAHEIIGTPLEAKISFYELAKPKVRIVSREEYSRFESAVFDHPLLRGLKRLIWKIGPVFLSPTSAAFKMDVHENKSACRKWVSGLDIRVNGDFFHYGDDDFTDLIPNAVEHEISEMWMLAKKGYQPGDVEVNHLLARRKQVRMAMEEGKADRLLGFYRLKASKEDFDEFQQAFDTLSTRKT